jgi:hypothetical protein
LYIAGITHELTIKVKIGIIKALMISTLPNIERFGFDHDKNKLFIFSIFFFPIKFFTFYVIHSIKISQLADDTTLYFNSKNDISVAMNEIEIVGTFSGLMINRNKTEGLWIGKLRHSKDKVENIKWTSP